MSNQVRQDLIAKLAQFPRIPLATLPTPLQPSPRLTDALGGPTLYIKRDDMTGLAFGGNKTRHLEFVMADVLREKPEVLVTGANIQSNWSRQSVAAAVKMGIPIVLVLRNSDMQEIQGNVLLDLWMGAEVHFVNEPDMTMMENHIDDMVTELRSQGKRAFKLDSWSPLTAIAYVNMMVELQEQCEAMGITPTRLWLAAAGPTQAGIVLGARLLDWNIRITGVAPLRWTNGPTPDLTADIANQAAELLGTDFRIALDDVENLEQYIGAGYAIPSREGLEAMRLAARTDAILLDPVYTGKAMAGLIDHVRRGVLTRADTVIFLHTGGLPANFAYRDAILEMAKSR
ncbi:MAG TPA: D-cysteine desulfhydrase family protein [Anaerolineae bacterium]|nr:D-cysteine desulfhydrase family protein [Anaerolineae bacterium]